MGKMVLNKLPAPTFRYIGVNFTEREAEPAKQAEIIASGRAEPVRIERNTEESAEYNLTVNAVERLDVYIYSTAGGFCDIKADIMAGGELTLIQVFEKSASNISRVKANIGDSGAFKSVVLVIDAQDTVCEVDTKLSGRGARFECDTGFVLDRDSRADINVIATHTGKKTVSEITARGVLSGRAEKIFKGTIDFKKGAKGSKGTESEETLLLNDEVRNRTVPLILCAEEQVEGSHGASIGRLDGKSVFYMRSRGIPEEKIYRLLANAKIEQILRKTDDSQTAERVRRAISGGEEDE